MTPTSDSFFHEDHSDVFPGKYCFAGAKLQDTCQLRGNIWHHCKILQLLEITWFFSWFVAKYCFAGANYKTPGNIQAVFTSTAWSVNMANRRLSSGKLRLNALNERPTYGGINQPTYNRSAGATPNSKNSLYQQRKHSWRSRRPVQCPNCQKVITMAYNLKSHLSTCLKRNGVRNKVQIKCEGNSTSFWASCDIA